MRMLVCALCGYEEPETTAADWGADDAGGGGLVCPVCLEVGVEARRGLEGRLVAGRHGEPLSEPEEELAAREARSGGMLRRLAAAHGYRAVALDGLCGSVETPLFPPDQTEPDYLTLRMRARGRTRFPTLAVALVDWVDAERELVFLRATRADLAALPEHLPLAI